MPSSHIIAQPLLNGAPLPDFELRDSEDRPVTLADVTGPNGVVVAFIHATWCPFCLRQLMRLNALAPRLAERSVGLVCISADATDAIYAYERSVQPPLTYPLLADSHPSISHQFGVYDGHPNHEAPYPSLFYAGRDGRVAYSDVSGDPDCFPNIQRLLEVIDYGPEGEPPNPLLK
ncbi:MAG: peroxiredoxin family protein [Chloroflexi bacterium]|nr:peroxiredoxin family protein [Chloroflexota bacterium]MCI0648926.1 peroxiredoxin family protein [Chloroflexota bacterium]